MNSKLCEKYELLPRGSRVLCAVSGGADSMCLLHMLWSRREELGIEVAAAHFEHGLRGEESLRDAAFVESYCADNNILCVVSHGNVPEYAEKNGLGAEEAARILRYEFLEKKARELGFDRIATAHNADDNAETMLFNLCRGAGLTGLCGIPPMRGNIVRPLLDMTRTDIEKYLCEHGVPHVEDSSNQRDDYSRNILLVFENGTVAKFGLSAYETKSNRRKLVKAFSGKSVKTVILPKSIQTLASNAFYNCPQLGSVYMFDMITSMKSDSFANCPKLTTLYINNANSIKYVGASSKEGMYHMKFQRLLLNRDKKKIVIVSGSNAIFGILSPVVMEKLNNEYEVINYGTNFYCPSALYVEAVSHFVKEGDIVVITPEEVPEQWGDIGTRGKNQLFPAIEGCMEIISCLNIQNYLHWLPEIASMNGKRVGGSQSYESTYSEAVDEYGEFSYTRTQQNPKFSNTSLSDWFGPTVRSQCFTTENVKNLNRSFDLCVANGAKIYISFSVVDKSYVSDQSASNLKAYEDAAVASFVTGHTGRALISHVSTYLFDHSCFYNSMHHLLSEPSVRRSELLAEDILAQLKKEK